ncbi:MAG TPA: hypothetical protein VFX37_02730, partial [Pseudolabrys sp.]|nr:hypothetical protein [Pseudolabrys sp.]
MPVGSISLSSVHACALRRIGQCCLALAALCMLVLPIARSSAAIEPLKGTLSIETDAGYARLAFRFADEVKAQVTLSGAIMVIKFDRPVAIPVDKIALQASDYISAARRDPDGTAIRLALARKLKFNVIPAAEHLYIDLLPMTWTGILPGLPQEVIDELAERARKAERELHRERGDKPKSPAPTIRVKVGTQPTFMRYEFSLPEGASASPSRTDGKLTLNFNRSIRWDLADAKASLPAALSSIEGKQADASAQVVFTFKGKPELRAFQDGRSFMVDVGTGGGPMVPAIKVSEPHAGAAPGDKMPVVSAPRTMPAKNAVASALPTPSAPLPKPEKPQTAEHAEKHGAPTGPAIATEQSGHGAERAKPQPPKAKQVEAKAKPSQRHSSPLLDPSAAVVADVVQTGDNLSVDFPFAVPTPAAVFRRADMLWLVFDSAAKIDVSALKADTARIVRAVSLDHGKDGEAIVRIRLVRPQLASLV